MPSWEIVLFVVAAVVAGGLSMGGVTLVYFLDQWREHPERTERAESARGETDGPAHDRRPHVPR